MDDDFVKFNDEKDLKIGDGRIKYIPNYKGIKHLVIFTGRISNHKLKKEYAKARVYVLPSLVNENSPLTIQEAISQGTPVITTDIGGQKELVRDGYNGFLVEPGNSEDLAEKIKIILQDEELRRKMSKNCLKEARKFSPEEHIKKIEYLFQLMIRGGKH